MMAFFDIGLTYDPATRRVDLSLGPDGDLVIDMTPATPMLLSLGCDGRAGADDELPSGRDEALNGNSPSFLTRRGCPGDALDAQGRRTGSLLWLLERAKQTEITRQRAEDYISACLAWAEDETGSAAEVEVDWLRKNVLGFVARVDGTAIQLARGI